MTDVKLLIDQLKSWRDAYLPPSAAITMDVAAEIIAEQQKTIEELTNTVNELAASLRLNASQISATAEEKPVAPKKRATRKVAK